MRAGAIVLTLAVLLIGCGGSDSEDADESTTTSTEAGTSTTTSTSAPTTTGAESTTTTEAETEAPPAPETRTLTVDGIDRSYLLFVSSNLDPSEPAPLILNLHGAGDIANRLVSTSQFNALADDEGIIVAYPNALGGEGFGAPTSWKFEDDSDVIFMDAIVDDIASQSSVDSSRLYAIGFSQGGDFSAMLTCRQPGRYAAVALVAVMNHHTASTCSAAHAAPILAFVGTADTVYSIDEGLTIDVPDPDPPGPLAKEAGEWAATNQCGDSPGESEPATGVVRQDYDCESGALVIYIHGGEHVWPQPETEGINANTLIWDFLRSYTTPT